MSEAVPENAVSPEIEREVGRQLVKYAVQRQIMCPVSGAVLDMRRAVLVDVETADGKTISSTVMAASVYDERGATLPELIGNLKAVGKLPSDANLTIYDGRQLWGGR